MGKWATKDGKIELEILADGFRFIDRDEPTIYKGEITILADRVWLDRHEDDGAYAKLTDRGQLFLRRDGEDWVIELSRKEDK